MIERIEINRLFGLYDYDIELSSKPAVKILTGPNGYGKTTILLAIDHLYKGDFWYFHFLSYDSMLITLTNQVISIRKISLEDGENSFDKRSENTEKNRYNETIVLLDKGGNEIETVTISEDYIFALVTDYRKKLSWEQKYISDEELLTRYYTRQEDDYIQEHSRNIALALQEYETKFLPAQRVYNQIVGQQREYRSMRVSYYEIDHVNEEIGLQYRRTQSSFAATSQRIDATFISRLVKRTESYSYQELQDKLGTLKNRIDAFKELNIFSNMELLDYSMEDEGSYEKLKIALSLYVDDMNSKMDMFESLYKKMSLYRRVVTNKVLSEKTIDFSEYGLTVKNINGKELEDLHKLSSGEQNLLILYYNLIFKSNNTTILLIDEPENSLHMAWLSKMLEDYLDMANTTGCQIILATHSPTFINGRWDLTTDLYRQYKGKDE